MIFSFFSVRWLRARSKSLPVKGAAINAVIVIVYFYDRSFCVVNASADDSAMCMYFVRIMFSNQMVYFRSHI